MTAQSRFYPKRIFSRASKVTSSIFLTGDCIDCMLF